MTENKIEVRSIQDNCSRCGKIADLRPYKFSRVVYRAKEIKMP